MRAATAKTWTAGCSTPSSVYPEAVSSPNSTRGGSWKSFFWLRGPEHDRGLTQGSACIEAKPQSPRSATIGSTRVARLAGTQPARTVMTARTSAVPPKLIGSVDVML